MKTSKIKFNQNFITDGITKARVSYTFGEIFKRDKMGHPVVGTAAKCVTVYGKNYSSALSKIFGDQVENGTDIMTDYFENDCIRFYEGDKFYKQAFAAYTAKTAGCIARWNKKYGTDQAAGLRRMVAEHA